MSAALANPAEMIERGAPRIIHNDAEVFRVSFEIHLNLFHKLWPFDGVLDDLLLPGALVVTETYPACI